MFTRRAQLHCPLCNVALNVEMTVKLPPKFESAADSFSNLYINSMGQLFQIANGHANADNFKRRQANKTIQYIFSLQKKKEDKLKKLLRKMEFQNIVPFFDDELIEIRELWKNNLPTKDSSTNRQKVGPYEKQSFGGGKQASAFSVLRIKEEPYEETSDYGWSISSKTRNRGWSSSSKT
uniref:Uncharacterized protein n=1 Tax=Globodera rostochiensis TaxID=31243 RepID=A0A914HQ38_GLORO